MKRKLKILAAVAALWLVLYCSTSAWRVYDAAASAKLEKEKKIYAALVAQQIYADWKCVPTEKHEGFVLSLMKRFSPNDYETLTTGRKRKLALEKKAQDGTLTVAERDELNSGFYDGLGSQPDGPDPHLPEKEFRAEMNRHFDRTNGNFSKPNCVARQRAVILFRMTDEKIAEYCKPPFTNVHLDSGDLEVIYEDKFSSWKLRPSALASEFEKLPVSNRTATLQHQLDLEQQRSDYKAQAERIVAQLPAEEVPAGTEKIRVEQEAEKLACRAK